MTYDNAEDSLGKEEIEAVKQNARMRVHTWRRRALYSTLALLLSFALVYPFVDGRVLTAGGEALKRALLLLSLALLLAFLYCTLLLWGAWRAYGELKKD